MAQAAQTLDCDEGTGCDVELANTVENGYAGAEQGGRFSWVGIVRDSYYGFGTENAVLLICV